MSPIYAAEIPLCKDTIVYYDGEEAVEENDKQRAAKRRRIQSYATAYLRGESLFISTAQLKGPFDSGWQNPWKRRKRDDIKHSTRRKVTEDAAGKPTLQQRQSSVAPAKRPEPPQTDSNGATPFEPSKKTLPEPIPHGLSESAIPTKDTNEANPLIADRPSSQKNRRVEDWLKNNDSYMPADSAQGSFSSPLANKSPHSRPKKWEHSPTGVAIPPMLDAIVQVAKSFRSTIESTTSTRAQDDKLHVKDVKPDVKQLALGAERSVKSRRSSSWHAGAHEEPTVPLGKTVHAGDPFDGPRADHAVLQTKRTLMPTVDLAASSSHPQQQASSTPDEDKFSHLDVTRTNENRENREASDIESQVLHTAPEKPLPLQVEPLPAISRDQPSPNTTNDLPSAQLPPQPTLRSARSNVTSNGEMLELPLAEVPPSALRVDAIEQPALPVQGQTDTGLSYTHLTKPSALSCSKDADGNGATRAGKNEEPKLYGAMASKVGFAGRASPDRGKCSPAKASSKFRVTKSRKKASFTTSEKCEKSPGSSQGTIKSAMRVAKPATSSETNVNLKSALSHSPGCCEQNDVEQTSLCDLDGVSKVSRTMLAPKGILKSCVSAAVGPSASSGSKQDAQRPGRLDMMEDGSGQFRNDAFDLDAAIDDLGSFLGTWDAETAAVQLSNASGRSCVASETGI